MEGLAFVLKSTKKEGGGGTLDDLSTLEPGHKSSYLRRPEAAEKGSAQQGLFLKTRAHGSKEEEEVVTDRKRKSERANARLA